MGFQECSAMYYGITPHKTFIQKPYREGTPQLHEHVQGTEEERGDLDVRRPLPYKDDQAWKAAISAKQQQ